MSDVALLEPETAQHQHGEPHHQPQHEAVAEVVPVRHVDEETAKRIAVQNLSKINFLIAPDGGGAVAAEPIKTNEQARVVSESLNVLLGAHSEGATHSTAPENGFLELPVGNVTRIHTAEAVRTLAEAGVKDFADALNISRTTHTARIR
ncbi:MAG: hypothetical protein CV089_08855 [Nitrospira sp. WS110]|nr:hypothetical protein [Nitrospira sp. WS110]